MSSISLSFVQGKGSLNHNNRVFISDNIIKDRIKDNITFKKESLECAYEKLFKDEIERYDSKQKRKDRKIVDVKNYMNKLKNSKNDEKLFYENVVMLGDKISVGSSEENKKKATEILKEYAKTFQKRNPNLYLFNAVLHLDEATPHLHLDYIPVGVGYQRGLNKRNSLTKALSNMGFERGNENFNSTMAWQNREREFIRNIALDYDMKLEKQNSVKRKQLTVDQYKAAVEYADKKFDCSETYDLNYRENKFNKDEIIINKKDFEEYKNIVDQSKAHSELYAEAIKLLADDEKKLKEKYKQLKEKEDNLKDHDILISKVLKENDEFIEQSVIDYERIERLKNENKELKKENRILKQIDKKKKTDYEM